MILPVNVDKFIADNKLQEVTSSNIFMGRTSTYHPNGLFSEEIFGIDGSPDRRKTLAYINLHCKVIHPAFYDILSKRIFRKINKLLAGDKTFSVDPEGDLVEDPNGDIDGFTKFAEILHTLNFRKTGDESSDRDKIIDMLKTNINNGTFLMDKMIVISPEFRPISLGEEFPENPKDYKVDEMNNIYQSILRMANQVRGVSGTMYDILSYKLQVEIKNMYEMVKLKVAKKYGAIRNLMLGKRVDFSARSVITPNPNLHLGEVGIPLKIACSIFEPFLIYALVNSPEAQRLPAEFHTALKEFLGKELDPDLVL
jgi:DNA-directed RNA polymerase beta' subunit